MASRVTSLRLPVDLVDAIDAHAGRRNRSKFFHDAARSVLSDESGVADPLDRLHELAPAIAAALQSCSTERRAAMKADVKLIADAYTTRAST